MCQKSRLVSGLVVGICLFVGQLPTQQGERLPFNVGYLDELVQNPDNPTEVVGYLQTG